MNETVSIELITPEIARKLLIRNDGNRNLRSHRVAQYVKAMQEGGWLLTGDAVVISRDGELINGQHRLSAVDESGTSQPFIVMRGANSAVYAVMDSGSPRSTRDLFIHNGVQRYINEKCAISSMIHSYLSGRQPGTRPSPTDASYPNSGGLYAIYTDYTAEIDFAARACSDCSMLGAKSHIGFALWLIATEASIEEAEEFAELVSPLNRDAQSGGFPPRALRDHFVRGKAEGRKSLPKEIAYKFAFAFNAWMRGEELKRLTWEEGRAFPEIVRERKVAV